MVQYRLVGRTINTGHASLGTGNNDFNLQSINAGLNVPLAGKPDWQLGFQGDYAHSQSDGTIDNGDHDFTRASGRVQLTGPQSQTDLFYGSQKFFGSPTFFSPVGEPKQRCLIQLLMLDNLTRL